jgi:hypothetical protein
VNVPYRVTQTVGIDGPGVKIAAMVVDQPAPQRLVQHRRVQHGDPVHIPVLVQKTVQALEGGLVLLFQQQQAERKRPRLQLAAGFGQRGRPANLPSSHHMMRPIQYGAVPNRHAKYGFFRHADWTKKDGESSTFPIKH